MFLLDFEVTVRFSETMQVFDTIIFIGFSN